MLEKHSVAEQAASYLRQELSRRRWQGRMPGRDKLARELGVHGSTVERALQQLEQEGLLEKSGPGKARRIVESNQAPARLPSLTVGVLLYDPGDQTDDYILKLQYELGAAGHRMSFAPRSMSELKFDPGRIAAMITKQAADAWIVYSGSKPILERLLELPCPVFALFGRMSDLPIAGSGTDILAALRETVEVLHSQGHRRIVMLTRTQLMTSGPGLTERTFIEALEQNDLPHSAYNLAEWDNTAAGLKQCLNRLFQLTPPTAIFVDDWMIHNAVQNYLIHEHRMDEQNLCCISMDYHPSFAWLQPHAPHFYWDPAAVVRHAVTWVRHIGRGRTPVSQKLVKAELRGRESLTWVGVA